MGRTIAPNHCTEIPPSPTPARFEAPAATNLPEPCTDDRSARLRAHILSRPSCPVVAPNLGTESSRPPQHRRTRPPASANRRPEDARQGLAG
ncbi:hypothetical protein RJ55_02594 [Drechmeria coniospora]|nr:hypothetical protein RJ55_02594 [Drechmeria coniospora]